MQPIIKEQQPIQQPQNSEVFFPTPGIQNPEFPAYDPAMEGKTPAVEAGPNPFAASPDAQYQTAKDSLDARLEMVNIAEKLDDNKKAEIANKVRRDYDIDYDSCAAWREQQKRLIEMARMDYMAGAEGQSNVRFPLLATAAIHFQSRAYAEFVRGDEAVLYKVIGKDEDGAKKVRSERLKRFANSQLFTTMKGWEDDEDQLLSSLPVLGCMLKKTFYCATTKQPVSKTLFPYEVVVNYAEKNIEDAARVTHVIELKPNEIKERMTGGVFLDTDMQLLTRTSEDGRSDDEDAPHIFLEQHRYLDLDDDGYQEPYVVTIHKDTEKLMRISARYNADGIIQADNGDIARIEPQHYFTRFLFLRSPDGGFYGLGLGALLYGLNEAASTIYNQLIDAGTQKNRPSGFLGRGITVGRTPGGGGLRLKPGEWRPVNNTGDDLRKNVFAMPAGEPSAVLFSLLGTTIDVSEKIAMMSDALTGEGAANQPATTTLALIEQGLKVFSAIMKRIFLAHKEEFIKLHRINRMFLSIDDYQNILDDPAATKDDFIEGTIDVLPVADPTTATDTQRLMRAKAVMELRGTGLNDNAIVKRYLEAIGIDEVEKILPQEQQADPAAALAIEKLQLENAKLQAEIDKIKSESDQKKAGIVFDKAKLRMDAIIADYEHNPKFRTDLTQGIKKADAELKNEPAQDAGKAPVRTESPAPQMTALEGKTPDIEPPGEAGLYNERGMESNNIE